MLVRPTTYPKYPPASFTNFLKQLNSCMPVPVLVMANQKSPVSPCPLENFDITPDIYVHSSRKHYVEAYSLQIGPYVDVNI